MLIFFIEIENFNLCLKCQSQALKFGEAFISVANLNNVQKGVNSNDFKMNLQRKYFNHVSAALTILHVKWTCLLHYNEGKKRAKNDKILT